jgi:hypothetical protein
MVIIEYVFNQCMVDPTGSVSRPAIMRSRGGERRRGVEREMSWPPPNSTLTTRTQFLRLDWARRFLSQATDPNVNTHQSDHRIPSVQIQLKQDFQTPRLVWKFRLRLLQQVYF